MLLRAADSPAVLLGEQHDRASHHRWQLQTLVALHAYNPALAVGLEMLPRRYQPVLDRWTAGELTAAQFLKATDWSKVWGFDPDYYMPILYFARMNKLPVVALNVDRALVARTAREGWAAIPESDREGVGNPAPATAAYRDRLREAMSAHSKAEPDSPKFQRFVEAQLLWDRAMAERIAETRRDTGRTVVAILGMGHIEGHEGVPYQLADLGIGKSMVLLPWDPDRPCADLNGGVADAVFGLAREPAEPEPARPHLGVMLQPAADGARVGSVAADGVAAAAGLKAGDVVIAAAGEKVGDADALSAIIRRQAPGTWLPLTLRREGRTLHLVAKFPPTAG